MVDGIKLWAMWPPYDSFYSNVPSRKFWKNIFNKTYYTKHNRSEPMLCIQYPGETLYVPPTWAHFTMVLSDESYSFADSFSASVSGYLSQLW